MTKREILPKDRFTKNIKSLKRKKRDIINEIAVELSYNYFANSFGDNDKTNINTEDIFSDTLLAKEFESRRRGNCDNISNPTKRVRNILVIGAGASADLFKGIHTGEWLMEEMNDIFLKKIENIDFLNEKYKYEKNAILELTRQEELTLENYLYLLGKCFVPQSILREKIKEMTDIKYSPSLFNEIVAHLLKHGFLDVVINFNFEETLDNSIEEEIGKENYIEVVSDGTCIDLRDILIEGRLKTPIYIKPHGSNGHKSTLRYTNSHYFDLPADIKKMLEQIVGGVRGDKEDDKISRINLIAVGFKMESSEFNKILNNHLPADSVIYHIDYQPIDLTDIEKRNELKNKFKDFFKRASDKNHIDIKDSTESFSKVYKSISLRRFHQNDDIINKKKSKGKDKEITTSPLCELFSVIWRLTYFTFKKTYFPRSIGQHEITSYLFYEAHMGAMDWANNIGKNEQLKKRIEKRNYIYEKIEKNAYYFLDKALVQIAISVNRNNGLIDIIELSKGRVGRYYNLFLKNLKPDVQKNNIPSLYDLLYEIVGQQEFEDKDFKSSTNVFTLKDLQNSKHNDENEGAKRIEENFKNTYLEQPYLNINTTNFNNRKSDFYKKIQEYVIKNNDNLARIRTITILTRLFSSKKLSNRFKLNLLFNFNKKVDNGWVNMPEKERGNLKKKNNTLFEEIYRLFEKTVGKDYLVINTKPNETSHHIFESFEKKNLIHTNIGLTYEFNNIFLKKQWDILLVVSETGSNFDFLKNYKLENSDSINLKKAYFKDKHFIIICSFESVKQLYSISELKKDILNQKKEITDKQLNKEIVEKHKQSLCGEILEKKNLTLCFVNWREHNHHSVIFLKTIPKNDAEWKTPSNNLAVLKGKNAEYGFICSNSIYMHQDGLSNVIDPLFVGVNDNELFKKYTTQDQYKLLTLFYIHLLRSAKFNSQINLNLESYISEKHTSVLNILKQSNNHKNWSSEELINSLKVFLGNLYSDIV